MEVLYHIRPYFVGIFSYIGLIYGRYLQFRFLKFPLKICLVIHFLHRYALRGKSNDSNGSILARHGQTVWFLKPMSPSFPNMCPTIPGINSKPWPILDTQPHPKKKYRLTYRPRYGERFLPIQGNHMEPLPSPLPPPPTPTAARWESSPPATAPSVGATHLKAAPLRSPWILGWGLIQPQLKGAGLGYTGVILMVISYY